MVFGGPEVGGSGYLSLRGLTGVNGFKLVGENSQDYSGYSVSGLGDINGDGNTDLLIAADGYPSEGFHYGKGRSYVLFGRSGVGGSGEIILADLNGVSGFKIDGENIYDDSGRSVNDAGDVNGDGYDDFIVGACGYPSGNRLGRSYVIFGSSDVGNGGMLLLSDLDGINGFKLDGENNGDLSGCSVSAMRRYEW